MQIANWSDQICNLHFAIFNLQFPSTSVQIPPIRVIRVLCRHESYLNLCFQGVSMRPSEQVALSRRIHFVTRTLRIILENEQLRNQASNLMAGKPAGST